MHLHKNAAKKKEIMKIRATIITSKMYGVNTLYCDIDVYKCINTMTNKLTMAPVGGQIQTEKKNHTFFVKQLTHQRSWQASS